MDQPDQMGIMANKKLLNSGTAAAARETERMAVLAMLLAAVLDRCEGLGFFLTSGAPNDELVRLGGTLA